MKPSDWTPEQLSNASRYGICERCGAPREGGLVASDAGSQLFLICPNCLDLYDGPEYVAAIGGVRIFYWQFKERVEHDETFETIEEAVAYLFVHGVPDSGSQIKEFAPDEIRVGERAIRDAELNRLLDEYEMGPWRGPQRSPLAP